MQEYPKWVSGKLANSPEEEAAILGVDVAKLVGWTAPDTVQLPTDYVFREYPKYVLGKLVQTEDEELALLMAEAALTEVKMEAVLRAEETNDAG